MQEIISDIQAKTVFSCPVCGHTYKTEEARNCAAMGVWNKNFDTTSLLWRWNIFKPSRHSPSIIAIIPDKVKTKYTWCDTTSCKHRVVSLFVAFCHNFWTITNQTKIITLGILEGFERYHLIPPCSTCVTFLMGRLPTSRRR